MPAGSFAGLNLSGKHCAAALMAMLPSGSLNVMKEGRSGSTGYARCGPCPHPCWADLLKQFSPRGATLGRRLLPGGAAGVGILAYLQAFARQVCGSGRAVFPAAGRVRDIEDHWLSDADLPRWFKRCPQGAPGRPVHRLHTCLSTCARSHLTARTPLPSR